MTATAVKHLIKFDDLTKKSVEKIIKRAFEFKKAHEKGIRKEAVLQGKSVAIIFEKPSLRTRVAFELGTKYLGGEVVYLSAPQIFASGSNESGRESIPDISRVLERFVDLIVARVYQTETLEEINRVIACPVVNALCDKHHPSQALADLMCIQWHKGSTDGVKVAYVGDGNNVTNSLMQMCAMMGMDFSFAGPKNYEVSVEDQKIAQSYAAVSGAKLNFYEDPFEAVEQADVIYADTFISMGEEDQREQKLREFKNYQVNKKLMDAANKDALFMHCLPAHREEEVSTEVIDSPASVVFDQAECRMHVAKAIITHFLGEQ